MAKELVTGKDAKTQADDLRKQMAETKEQIERDKTARNAAEKTVRDGEKRLDALKSQLIDLLS